VAITSDCPVPATAVVAVTGRLCRQHLLSKQFPNIHPHKRSFKTQRGTILLPSVGWAGPGPQAGPFCFAERAPGVPAALGSAGGTRRSSAAIANGRDKGCAVTRWRFVNTRSHGGLTQHTATG